MKKRTSNIIFLTVIVILIAVSSNWIWNEYKMKNYETVCAKCIGFYKSKSYWFYKFEFESAGEKLIVSRKGNHFTDDIKQYIDSNACFEIAYSKSDNSSIRIIDEKLGSDWLWFLEENDKVPL